MQCRALPPCTVVHYPALYCTVLRCPAPLHMGVNLSISRALALQLCAWIVLLFDESNSMNLLKMSTEGLQFISFFIGFGYISMRKKKGLSKLRMQLDLISIAGKWQGHEGRCSRHPQSQSSTGAFRYVPDLAPLFWYQAGSGISIILHERRGGNHQTSRRGLSPLPIK
jgi:hypothetical protein